MWWRLYESDIIDKEELISQKNWIDYFRLIDTPVRSFISSLNEAGYHSITYAFYGNKIKSDGTVRWNISSITYAKDTPESDKKNPNNYREIMDTRFNRSRLYKLEASNSPGDGTVPIESFNVIKQKNGQAIKSVLATNVEHQGAYDVDNLADIHKRPALKFTLRAIVKMVQGVPLS